MTQRNPRRMRLSACKLLCVGVALVPLQMARADDAPGANAPTATSLKEIMVTAQRRKQPLQQVPISVVAITAEQMTQRSMVNLQDVVQATPNVSYLYQAQTGSSAGLLYIRGIGQSNSVITDDPGVGVYLDGVYYGVMQGVNIDSLDVARIEILRGPQGTLFGKNTIGGAVNIVTNEPSLESTMGDAQLTTGSYRRADATAWLSAPVIPGRLAMSLAVGSQNQSGYGTRLSDGQGMGNVKQLNGRFEARYKATDSLDFLFTADGTRLNEDGADVKLLAINTATPLVGLVNLISVPPYDSRWLTGSNYTSYATGNNFNRANIWGTSLTATWSTGPVAVKSITAYRHNYTDYGLDDDGSPLNLFNQTVPVDQSQFSQELQFSGLSLGERLNWVAGLYYFREQAIEDITDDLFVPLNALGIDASFNTNVGASDKSYAAYGQGTYAFTDRFHLTLGVRESYERKTGNVFRYAPFAADATIIPFTQKSGSWDSFTPRITFEYQFTPDVMGYISAAEGFKSGGFNGLANNAASLVAYNPEKAWTYEVGERAELLEQRLRVNATAYYTDYTDIQYDIIQAASNGSPNVIVGNAARARIDGGELELDAIPVTNLTLSLSGGLTDAKYTSVTPAAEAVGLTTSSPFVNTPKWSGSVGGQYVIGLTQDMDIVAHTDLTYRSRVYFDLPITPYVIQGGYSTVDARLTLRAKEHGWSISAFGTNLTNKQYMNGAFDFSSALGFATGIFAPPREWGATFEYRF